MLESQSSAAAASHERQSEIDEALERAEQAATLLASDKFAIECANGSQPRSAVERPQLVENA